MRLQRRPLIRSGPARRLRARVASRRAEAGEQRERDQQARRPHARSRLRPRQIQRLARASTRKPISAASSSQGLSSTGGATSRPPERSGRPGVVGGRQHFARRHRVDRDQRFRRAIEAGGMRRVAGAGEAVRDRLRVRRRSAERAEAVERAVGRERLADLRRGWRPRPARRRPGRPRGAAFRRTGRRSAGSTTSCRR